jgi:hypothetical protein
MLTLAYLAGIYLLGAVIVAVLPYQCRPDSTP